MDIREIIFNIVTTVFCIMMAWSAYKMSKDFATEEKK